MEFISHPKVKAVFDNYPQAVQARMLHLRTLVLSVAAEIDGMEKLEETLKWGEPSYLCKNGSTLRMDWKEKKPEQYAIYFKYTSRLVPTFKEIYANTFVFEGNRAIVFQLNDKIPEAALKHCMAMTLTYHKIKHLPLLGA